MEQKLQLEEQINQLQLALSNFETKEFKIFFFVLDTKGNPTAGIANIYEHVKILKNLGYNASILHEKNDYKLKGDQEGNGIADWLGEEYASLPHTSIESQQLTIGPADFVVIPEVFSNIMDQLKGFPCKKIVMSQSYDYLLELLQIGKRWNVDYGFNDVITTSEKQANYVKSLFPSIQTHVIPVSISDIFKDSDKPKIPVVSIMTRNHGDAAKIAKSFYLQYPLYKWITFKELRGIPKKQFATELSKSCLAVWIDDQAGFGTFPLEAIECNTPVIAKIPNMVPEWMETTNEEGVKVIKNNGVWTNTTLNIPELIANYLKIWFEDSIPQELINSMEESKGKYTSENQIKIATEIYTNLFENRKAELTILLENSLVSLNQTEPTNA
jgi:hypothetical protein